MAKPGKTGISRIIDATGYSFKGLKAAWTHEAAFRQELLMLLIGCPLGFWLAEDRFEFLWLILPLFLVVLCELCNSAIEAVVDRVGSEMHELSGRAKDIGSALVFVSLVLTTLIWALVLVPKWINF